MVSRSISSAHRDIAGADAERTKGAPSPINSEAYWSERFRGDWEAMGGPAQSRYFYNLALSHIPSWLFERIQNRRSTLCDWGCATGDGAELLAEELNASVTGVDFSEAAIEIARKRYNRANFRAVNLLTEEVDEAQRYDILFTSNTLEHFSDPWRVLTSVSKFARDILVVLIPFREYDRHHEHEATFDAETIPAIVDSDFHLVFAKAIDTRDNTPCFWNGEQILLVYARASVIEDENLHLTNIEVSDDPVSNSGERASVLTLKRAHEASQSRVQQVEGVLAHAETEVNDLRERLQLAMTQEHELRERLQLAMTQEHELRERLQLAMTQEHELRERLQLAMTQEHELRERLQLAAAHENDLRDRLQLAAAQEHELRERLQLAAAHENDLRDRLQISVAQELELRERLQLAAAHENDLRGRLQFAAAQENDLRERLKSIEGQANSQQDHIHALERDLSERSDEMHQLRGDVVRLHEQKNAKDNEIHELQRQINALHASRSWRVTSPIRRGTNITRQLRTTLRSSARPLARFGYRVAPLPTSLKQGLKRSIIRWMRGDAATSAVASLASVEVAPAQIATTPIASPNWDLTGNEATALTPPLRGRREVPDVFVWGIIDWHFRIQRPQHISRGLASLGYRTFYFSNHFVDAAEPGFKIEPLSADGLLNVVYLNVVGVPSIYSSAPSTATSDALRSSLAAFLREVSPRSTLSIVQHPFWTQFADIVPNRRLIYDMMDHHEGFGDGASDILELEERILREADQVVVTSDFLENIARGKNRNVTVVRNACEYDHFSSEPSRVYVDPNGRRIIGYYGAIAHWFDVELVAKVAERFSDDLILLVGADSAGVQERLGKYPNVQFTGEVRYAELPYYLYSFDVCLLPFKVIPLTLATNPVKVYEYLSAGKPVVSVDLPEISQFKGLVAVGSTHDEFVAQIDAVLRQETTQEEIAARQKFAAEQTWGARALQLCRAIEDATVPRVSVIIVTYNKLELTDSCLRSLENNTHYPNIEIIVVDNFSQDGTRDYLTKWAAAGENRVAILNDSNKGFAAANNQGISRATGDFFVLLNNDTYVTPGWLGTLVRHLQRDATLGLVGPVTNSIGNEARIDIFYDSMDDMEREALRYTTAHLGETYPLRTAAFFCVALSRATFEKVGPLDEEFGVGMFEDDDYCRRIEEINLRSACAEDVFVHHHHSASFNEIASERRVMMFIANREIYERKWGAWVPHVYRRKA